MAAQNGRTDVVKFLVSNGADVNARDWVCAHCAHSHPCRSSCSLVRAARGGAPAPRARARAQRAGRHRRRTHALAHALPLAAAYCPSVRLTLFVQTPFALQNDRTPLSHAAQYCHTEVVRVLLAAGATSSVKADAEKGGLYPLHYAAARGASGVVKLLLAQQGAAADVRDQDDNTPLHHAACGGHEATAVLLLDKGAAVDARCESGTAPLREAAVHGHAGVARLLLQQGAAVELRGREPNVRALLPLTFPYSRLP